MVRYKYKVLKITNNLQEYPECKEDTENHPELVEGVEDEMSVFILGENGGYFPADEFFSMVDITEFSIELG